MSKVSRVAGGSRSRNNQHKNKIIILAKYNNRESYDIVPVAKMTVM